LTGSGIGNLGDKAVDNAARLFAIDKGFSVHDGVVVVHPGLVHIEFSCREAAAQFLEATAGELQVGGRSFAVKHPLATAPVSRKEVAEEEAATTVLMVRGVWDSTQKEIVEAFSQVAPRIKSVNIPKTFSGNSRGHAFVTFHEIYEAATALRLLRARGLTVSGKKCLVEYAPPDSIEDAFAREAERAKPDERVQEAHATALSGVNGGMWASYLAMFAGGEDSSDPEAKRQRCG